MATESSFTVVPVNLTDNPPERGPQSAGEHMDFTLTPDQESFRDEVRAWFGRSMQQDWVRRLQQHGSDIPRPEAYELLRRWQRQMYEAGFVGLTWPKEATPVPSRSQPCQTESR